SITAFRSYCQRAGIEMQPMYGVVIPNDAAVREKNILQPDELKHVMSLDDAADDYIYAYQFFIATGLPIVYPPLTPDRISAVSLSIAILPPLPYPF
ncbi:MAG: hypothetical protein IKK18_04080, partial [Clostridia bacterium]|nr:hypothetical protein [Clostridia bacterium]